MLQTKKIFSSSENLAIENESLRASLTVRDEKIKYYESHISWLTEQIKSLSRGQYGSKSERWESEEQMLLINEAEVESKNPDKANDDDEIEVKGYTKKKRGHRRALPENLSREVVKIELPEIEQVSEDGCPLKVIGWRCRKS